MKSPVVDRRARMIAIQRCDPTGIELGGSRRFDSPIMPYSVEKGNPMHHEHHEDSSQELAVATLSIQKRSETKTTRSKYPMLEIWGILCNDL